MGSYGACILTLNIQVPHETFGIWYLMNGGRIGVMPSPPDMAIFGEMGVGGEKGGKEIHLPHFLWQN